MMRRRRPILERPVLLATLGGVLLLVACGALAAWQHRELVAQLEEESSVLHRLVSQRAVQHDAHLTALSAIATTSGGEQRDLFLDVAATIIRFYHRIDEVQLVPLDPQALAIGSAPLSPQTEGMVRAAARASHREIRLLAYPGRPDHYLMVKRSPNTEAARYGLAIAVDATRLLGDAGAFWSRPGVGLGLVLPDGQRLVAMNMPPGAIRLSRVLESASQPLLLETAMLITLPDLFPPLRTVAVLVAIALAYAVGLAVLRQRARVGAAMQQARFSALESRLAHASRVNALGEMASGLTHELTQPLTAILAQVQAGRRMLQRGDSAGLASVLDDTVAQARRASAILERFRNWSRPQRAPASAFDVREALANVKALLGPEAATRGVRLVFVMPETPVAIVADPVEMEQVAFNLVRNAIEATSDLKEADLKDAAQVVVTLTQDEARATLEVSDNGPGVPEDLRARLFTPFTTTRAGGMGLGLALSQRFVERAGGEIALAEGGQGATFTITLPRGEQVREAAQ